jgi:hypothetical protein
LLAFVFYFRAKRLEKLKEAPEPNHVRYEIDQLISEMEQHAGNYRLPEHVQQEIIQLCQELPEQTLQKYNNYFIGNAQPRADTTGGSMLAPVMYHSVMQGGLVSNAGTGGFAL